MYLIDLNETAAAVPCVATIGFFDGVHRGHLHLLGQVAAEARRRGLATCVVTFADHPRRTLAADFQPRLLTTLDEKLRLLDEAGVDRCCVLHFDRAMAALTARTFMERYLVRQLGVRALVIGYDHHFGSSREEGFAHYVRYGRELGIDVVRARAFDTAGVTVSSSAIRRFLEGGNAEMARLCLGRPYRLGGTVTEGRRVGRQLGFPTANLVPGCADKVVPATGAYAARALTDEATYGAMVNIGVCPTFDTDGRLTIEAHLFDFDGDLYGHALQLDFIGRLRGEQRFDSPEALRRQLLTDASVARQLLRS